MPACKKNHNAPEPLTANVKISPTNLAGEGAFHQHLRELIRGAMQVVMEEIIQEQLSLFEGSQVGRMHQDAPGLPQWVLHPRPGDRHRQDRGFERPQRSGRTIP